MQNLIAAKLRYCGYPVEVVEVIERIQDEARGPLVRAKVRYENDGFIASALLKESEIAQAV